MTARQWTCAACGRTDVWGPGWAWYGTIDAVDRRIAAGLMTEATS